MATKQETKNTAGLAPNMAAALCYVGAWITGIIFLLIEKENKTIRFHAMQSLITFGGLNILAMVPLIGWVLSPFIAILGFVLWLVCLLKAYQGEKFKLPLTGDLAEKWAEKVKL